MAYHVKISKDFGSYERRLHLLLDMHKCIDTEQSRLMDRINGHWSEYIDITTRIGELTAEGYLASADRLRVRMRELQEIITRLEAEYEDGKLNLQYRLEDCNTIIAEWL